MRLLALLLLLAGCASEPYWVRTHEPVPITSIRYVDYPCDRMVNACIRLRTGAVEIRRGMTEAETWCALNHERKHAAGYSHPNHREGSFASDCGNGEML